ncbi:hypothetical protein ONZ43_g1565 [Nemania bipapillata]|uniref:Uncharacterized protein n=1 Tax=Nemania bipapillata TaxID=110536 RepID=A0ACC2J425_9PEZI|nr:hypothetical protein ONZ43_g1565 [Nemania bipapillata]
MIGLEKVKKSVRDMITQVGHNRMREFMDLPPLQESLNKVFLGNPGTGKTTVARLYGQILVELGVLSNGEVVMKTPVDFIAAHAGGSENRTKAILDSTKGKVLVIDEAYGLSGTRQGAKGTRGLTDSYRSSIIDTLVSNVQGQAGDDRCILLLGYKDKMEEMYQDANPGFKRRFPLDNAFVFEDFTTGQLRQIWAQKLQTRGFSASKEAEDTAIEILERQRHRLNFGNAGEVDIILDAAQKRCLGRIQNTASSANGSIHLEPADVNPDYRRLAKASIDVEELFKGVVGCEKVKETIKAWPTVIKNAKERNMDIYELFSMNFAFTGPPGTGKTTTAKNIGTILYDLGLLATDEVNTISANELVGEYVGHTGPKVRRQFEASLGKVLFIDEAYRLSNSSHYGQEAIDEIVTCLTEDKFKNHLVVIFAGYEGHIKAFLNQNPGLASRVPEQLNFPPLTSNAAIELLCMHLNKGGFCANSLKNGGSAQIVVAMESLVSLGNWANGRSVENLSKDIKRVMLTVDQNSQNLHIKEETIVARIGIMRQKLIQQLPSHNFNQPKSPSPPVASDTMNASEPQLLITENELLPEEQITENKGGPAEPTTKGPKRTFAETSLDQTPDRTIKAPKNSANPSPATFLNPFSLLPSGPATFLSNPFASLLPANPATPSLPGSNINQNPGSGRG